MTFIFIIFLAVLELASFNKIVERALSHVTMGPVLAIPGTCRILLCCVIPKIQRISHLATQIGQVLGRRQNLKCGGGSGPVLLRSFFGAEHAFLWGNLANVYLEKHKRQRRYCKMKCGRILSPRTENTLHYHDTFLVAKSPKCVDFGEPLAELNIIQFQGMRHT